MKTRNKLTMLALWMLFPAAGMTQFNHLGVQAGFGTSVKEPGFGVSGMYRVNDEIQITPNLLYYLPDKLNTADGFRKFSWLSVNLDGTYVIINEGSLKGYGLMGLNFTNISGEVDEDTPGAPLDDKDSELKLGLNVGAGLRIHAGDKITPFAEIRYTLGDKVKFIWHDEEINAGQMVIQAGLLFRIAEDKERNTEEF